MITEQDLRAAIAECQGERNPNANTCIKLAAYYTILQNTFERPQASFDRQPSVSYEGQSEFAKAVGGKDTDEVMAVIDELMTTLQVLHPRLYNGVMNKLTE